MHHKRSIGILLLISLIIPSLSFGLDARRVVLDNGLVLLHSERHHLPLVQAVLLIKASPLDEPAEKAGLADLTAKMLIEGTKKRTSQRISEEIEFIGGSIGSYVDDDYTLITLSVLKKDIETGFDIFSDIILNPAFPEEELTHKKELLKGALKQREEDPQYVAEVEFGKAVYGEHPYGRPVTGTPEGIDAVTRKDVRNFHQNYYLPNNGMLSVAGDLTLTEIKELTARFLSTWKRGAVPERKRYDVNTIQSPKVITIDGELSQANIVLGHLGIERSHPDYYAVSVMNYILGGGGFSSRLMQTIRDEMGLAYDAHSFFRASKRKGVFQVGVQTKNESANSVIAEILKQMERMRDEYVGEEELKDAVSYLTGSFPRRLDTMEKMSRLLALVEFYGLGMDYDKKYIAYIKGITVEDIKRAAGKYLHPDKYILVVVADREKAGIKIQ